MRHYVNSNNRKKEKFFFSFWFIFISISHCLYYERAIETMRNVERENILFLSHSGYTNSSYEWLFINIHDAVDEIVNKNRYFSGWVRWTGWRICIYLSKVRRKQKKNYKTKSLTTGCGYRLRIIVNNHFKRRYKQYDVPNEFFGPLNIYTLLKKAF